MENCGQICLNIICEYFNWGEYIPRRGEMPRCIDWRRAFWKPGCSWMQYCWDSELVSSEILEQWFPLLYAMDFCEISQFFIIQLWIFIRIIVGLFPVNKQSILQHLGLLIYLSKHKIHWLISHIMFAVLLNMPCGSICFVKFVPTLLLALVQLHCSWKSDPSLLMKS